MAAIIFAQEIKWHALIMEIKAPHSNLEIAQFLTIRVFLYKVCKDLEAKDRNVSPVAQLKKHSRHADTIRTLEFIRQVQLTIDGNSRRFIMSITKECYLSEEQFEVLSMKTLDTSFM